MEAQPNGHIPIAIVQRAMQYKPVEPVSVQIAQAIIESSNGNPDDGKWFDSSLAVEHNNLFGHKWVASSIASGKVSKVTHEWINGVKTKIIQTFASYKDLDECFADHARIMKLRHYDAARIYINTPDQYAKRLSGVYSTDPEYGNNLIALMKRYDLYKYDTEVRKPADAVGDKVNNMFSPFISFVMGLVSLSGKKKWISYLIGVISVLFNHFGGGVPNPDLDKIMLALTAVYQGVEGGLDAIRQLITKLGGAPAAPGGPATFSNDGSSRRSTGS